MDDLDRVRDARAVLSRAGETLAELESRAPALAADMSWRSRTAEEFRLALDEWRTLLRWIADDIREWDRALAGIESRALAESGSGVAAGAP